MGEAKPHFSNRTLTAGERFTQSPAGRRLAWLATGSLRPNYRQTVLLSPIPVRDVPNLTEPVEGNPSAWGPPRFWRRALVVGAPKDELSAIASEYQKWNLVQAVAFAVDGVLHVGHHPQGKALFRPVQPPDIPSDEATTNMLGVAFRKGRGPFEGTIGYFIPQVRAFYGVEHPGVITRDVALGDLAVQHPGVLFV
jgi:hypothetical protein